MTAWMVHAFADLVGWPGEAVALLSVECESEALMRCAIALKRPAIQLHLFALYLGE